MSLLIVFIAIVAVGQAIAVGLGTIADAVSPGMGILVFFPLFAAVFWGGWWLAVRVTDRPPFVDPNQRLQSPR